MRQLAVLLVCFFLAAPLVAAQDPGPECRGAECRPACDERPCTMSQTNTQTHTRPGPDDRAQRFCTENPRTPHCQTDDGARITDLEHVSFVIDRENMWLEDVAINGHYIATVIAVKVSTNETLQAPTDVTVQQRGNTLVLTGNDWQLRIQDNPTGLLTMRGDAFLKIMVDANVTAHPRGALINYEGYQAIVAGMDVHTDGPLIAYGDTAFSLLRGTEKRSDVADRVQDAIEQRRLGGEVRIRDAATDVYTYDDVNITVDAPAAISQAAPLRVTFDAELDSGRTFVIDVDPDLLAGPDLDLRYYDVQDDGNETEVVFRQASGLEDILDATDDSGQPEYWVVEDENGLQVMVSVPHWSVHAITLSSLGEFIAQPSVIIGAAAGIAGVGVAGLMMLRPRRSDAISD